AEEARADDHMRRTGGQDGLRPLDAANAAPDAAGQMLADASHEKIVRARFHRAVEVDDLDFRIALELPYPREHVLRRDRQSPSLHELHDLAVFQIDRGNQHETFIILVRARGDFWAIRLWARGWAEISSARITCSYPDRDARGSEVVFQIGHGVFGEVKDR